MTSSNPIERVRLVGFATLALVLLAWGSLQWSALLRSSQPDAPTPPWWRHTHDASTIGDNDGRDAPRTRYHEWNISRADIAPDGVTRPMILVNGRFPGPHIQANVGDTLVVHVRNQLSHNDSSSFAGWDQRARSLFSTKVDDHYPPGSDERIAIHWHGLSMRGSPEQDGAPGFTSCATLPGESHTYRFRILPEDVGTHWWHSHAGMSRADGLWGTFTVLDPQQSERKRLAAHAATTGIASLRWDHEQVVTLGDHYFAPGIDQISWFISRHSLGFEPTPDNILINGLGRVDCTKLLGLSKQECTTRSDYPAIALQRNKTHRLRIVNVGSVGHQTFSIDRHALTVIEADGSLIVPYNTTRLSVAPGQRYSVLVPAHQTVELGGSFWLRTEMHHECFNMPNPNLADEAKAIVRYVDEAPDAAAHAVWSSSELDLRDGQRRRGMQLGSRQALPQTQAWPLRGGELPCHDEPASLLRPLRVGDRADAPLTPRVDVENGDMRTAVTVTMPKLDRNGLVPVSWINRTQWKAPNSPLLHSFALQSHTASGANPVDPRRQTVLVPGTSEPVTLELVINNADEAAHPFHLHGHRFHVVALSESSVGVGAYQPHGPNDDAQWFNEAEAVYRDTVSVPRRGFAVLRWKLDNPGVWAMHCHVLVHMQTGMALAVVDQPHRIAQLDFARNLTTAAYPSADVE
ncbi:hypothetical protein L1887_61696 [Cichorium endivia]|nr:hypothetical protein L1887_61696 [Cichorium endivia]